MTTKTLLKLEVMLYTIWKLPGNGNLFWARCFFYTTFSRAPLNHFFFMRWFFLNLFLYLLDYSDFKLSKFNPLRGWNLSLLYYIIIIIINN